MAKQSDKLRILFIARQYPPDMAWGGIGTYLAAIAPALVARGHEVHVLSCVEGQKEQDYSDRGVSVHCRSGNGVPGRYWKRVLSLAGGVLRSPKTLWRIERGLEVFFEYRRLGLEADVIEYPDWGALGCVLALLRPGPLVANIHTPPPSAYRIPRSRDMRWAWAAVYYSSRRADVTTVSSLFHVEELKADGWTLGEHRAVVPYPVDPDGWANVQPVAGTRPVALFVGRLEMIKAPEVLAAAIAIVRRSLPEATAVFLGRSSEEREGLPYRDWIKATVGDTSGCSFIGDVPQQEIMKYLSLSRVLVMPSVFDVYPLATLEAMAAGRPVIITEKSGVARQIQETGAGKAVPPGDPVALAGALLPFLEDVQYAGASGENARRAVREHNDIARIAAEREKVYLEAVRRYHGSPGVR